MTFLIVSILCYLIIGFIAGAVSGLFGIGGGVVMVPSLYLLFYLFGYPQNALMHLAIGTSLAAMVLSSFAAMRAHQKKKAILWDIVKKMLPGIVLGSTIGAFLAQRISGVILQVIFGGFLLILGYIFIKHKTPHLQEHKLPMRYLLWLFGALIGCIANILGMGGGTFFVPLLTSFRMAPKKAIGTSSCLSFFMATLGALFFALLNPHLSQLPQTIGFVHITAFFSTGICAFFVAPYAAELTHRLPDKQLKRLFGGVLILIGLSMLL